MTTAAIADRQQTFADVLARRREVNFTPATRDGLHATVVRAYRLLGEVLRRAGEPSLPDLADLIEEVQETLLVGMDPMHQEQAALEAEYQRFRKNGI